MFRRRFSLFQSLADRLAEDAQRLRQQAQDAPFGRKRERLVRKARQVETACHINDWLASPGLRPPRKEL
jgi:hypothetical protein